ncbi:hypothetical protein EDC01DRAFT_673077 [Geopyxis carbonaria]|nr:hypothetical protein EDC01DRAFT_673077 [Geopyxis carbonaria]
MRQTSFIPSLSTEPSRCCNSRLTTAQRLSAPQRRPLQKRANPTTTTTTTAPNTYHILHLTTAHSTMNRYITHAPYAEDQRLAAPILTIHVLHRGLAAGALIGALVAPPAHYFSKKPAAIKLPLRIAVLRSAGVGTVAGPLLFGAMLGAKMWGREAIEWQDRGWRLLANKSQNEVDVWSAMGMAAGAGGGVAAKIGWRGVMGGAGLGSLGATAMLMGWRMVRPTKRAKEVVVDL